MDTHKFGVVEYLDKDEVAFDDEDVVTWSYEGVLACLDNDDKENFNAYFIYTLPLEYLLE